MAPHRRTSPRMRSADLEEAVMARFDQGMHPQDIAAELGFSVRSVECVIGYMCISRADVAQAPVAIARSSAALLAAIARAHPERICA